MGSVRVVSTDTIKAPKSSDDHKIDLTPWDLQSLLGSSQKIGLVYHHPVVENQIQRLRHSLSYALSFFQPLAGRLKITEHKDNIVSCSITCNNAGVLFVHATAENSCVADILEPTYIPPFIYSFFPFIGVRNYEGTSQPLMAVQVTELVDGNFIGFSFNHAVVDGKSMWHFINSWAEISRGCFHQISKPPTLERWFPNGIQRPIQFPFTIEPQKNHYDGLSFSSSDDEKLYLSQRLFHFTKDTIAKLKSKVNTNICTNKITSLQALLSYLWFSVIRSKQFGPQEEVHNILVLGVRHRFAPPLQEDYFENAIIACKVTMKAKELLEEGGVDKGAWEMNKLIASHSNEKLKNHYVSWLRNPSFLLPSMFNNNSLVIGNSPRFDVYGNDFGWGKPVAVRSANKYNGYVDVFPGIEVGSMDLQVCFPREILETIGNDLEFMDVVSN